MTTPLALSRVSLGALDLGVVEAGGVAWAISDFQGWGSPASTVQVVQKPRANGGWAGPGYLPARTLSLTGTVDAPSTSALTDAVDRLSAACTLTDTTLTVYEAGRVRTCTVRRQGEVLVSTLQGSDRAASWSVQLVALDPRKTAAALTGSTSLPSSSGGLTVPFTVPFSINSTVVTGQINLTNPGNTTGSVVLRIDGPVVGPVVAHSSTGQPLVFGAANLSLVAGQFLLVDMDARTVLANGQASRAGYVTSRGWSGFDPGANTWSFTAQSGSGLLTVTAVPAWS